MNPENALGQLPVRLRKELLQALNKIMVNFREGRWEPSELNGGKFCEVVYSILNGHITGSFPQKSSKPPNMVDACNSLSRVPAAFPRSVRIQIPRMLIALYEVRNNRGVGHVGGEVDPNHMDATVVLYCSKWIMAELVRIFHNVDTQEATAVVEVLTERETPTIWKVNNKKRVLNTQLTMREKTLLLLYSENNRVTEKVLVSWTEHTNSGVYRRDVLIPGHRNRLWEYDKVDKSVTLSPLGIAYIESRLL
ncbi:MAG: hypothetical protein A2172_03320 [Candidatus Woykebacteria bacterium RBG_13_40_15]|uniref:Uncharacterized protein n=1 Tax=Candidatus Woykebacteria bacterium RBG_13_40_15 TaxID=1802593 RepID=A0A1G1W5K5_9BACT|nr:MAG: hypothetical protein A2172_03320 [Candidatus Woykebacteria bacterium RBG_13_40_15]